MALQPIEPEEMELKVGGFSGKTILEKSLGGIIILGLIIWIIRK
tara:strand:- start:983 stop:1114 length:132 start_codon:yes stop_codon:yes gene_type:complete